MPASASASTIRVALVGNPNTGKSTLFNALVGLRQRVGNYPGVTVEKKTGLLRHAGQTFELVDMPGTYSLAPRSPDEMVAVDVLLGHAEYDRPPEVVVAIVDASNIQRNLFLVSQLLSLRMPLVVALNMVDVARKCGVQIDVEKLAERLGVPVVATQATRGEGIGPLKQALADVATAAAEGRLGHRHESPFPTRFQEETTRLAEALGQRSGKPLPKGLVERLILDDEGYLERQLLADADDEQILQLHQARNALVEADIPLPAIEPMARYDWIATVLDGTVQQPAERPPTASDRIDAVLTHRVWGMLILLVVMALVFSSIFVLADPLMGMVDSGFGWAASVAETHLPEGALRSLLVSGVIGGVGAVLIFLPQILILFLIIAVLEDCGYMARAAFLMDRLMAGVGLSGRSFIPLLSSFACAVPGILAARVIENRRDRLATILIAPLMSCSARLPVYVILIGAFVPNEYYLGGLLGLQGLVLLAMYLVGIVAAVVVAWVLKRTILKGETPLFVMELPSYKRPSPATVLHRMFERGWEFLWDAGTVIFAVTIVVWALSYYPRADEQVATEIASRKAAIQKAIDAEPVGSQARAAAEQRLAAFIAPKNLDRLDASLHQRYSLLGQAGQWIEPAVRPLGWDWKIGCAAIASFPAREVVMGVLGVLYQLGGDLDVGDEADQHLLRERLKAARHDDTGKPVFNLPVALSLMVFFALCAQCAATLAVIRRETLSWRWPIFTFAYMTVLAYVGALITYQVGIRW